MTAMETTLRRDLESTALMRVQLVAVRCVGTNPKSSRRCNRLLAWLDGTARLTCHRCGTTMAYNVIQGLVRAAMDPNALTSR